MSGPAISSENTIFGLIGSEAAKGNPIDTTLNLAAGILQEMKDMDQPVLVDKYTSLLKERGIDINAGTFSSAQNPSLSRAASLSEWEKTKAITDQLFEEAGTRIRELAIVAPYKLNESGKAFAATNPAKSYGKLDEFFLHSKGFTNMTAWDHTAFNAPSQVKATFEIFQDLSLSGHFGAIKDIHNRLEWDGDPLMTRQVAEYLEGDSSVITNRMSAREALGTKAKNVRLSTPEGRKGSVFDMSREDAKSNFIIDLPDGDSVPVLGHDAYGGGSNRYGVGEYSATDRERSLHNLLSGHDNGASKEELARLKKVYIEGTAEREGLHDVLAGKNSYLRAPAIDPLGAGGFLQNRDSSLKLSTGEINPFEVKVNIDYVRRLKDKKLSKALIDGETAYGALARYPVSNVPLVSLKLDKSLQRNEFGIDEGLTPLIRGDFDKDSGYLFAFQKGSIGEEEAIKAVKEGSSQHESLANLAKQETEMFEELARHKGISPKSLEERMGKYIENFANTPEVHKRRLVSNTIGEYSNTRSMLMDQLEHSSTITNPVERDTLRHLFFNPYQSPISAAKAKAESSITFSGARELNARLADSLDGGSFKEFKSALDNVLQFAPESARRTTQESSELLERFHSGLNPEILRGTKAKVGSLVGDFAKADIAGGLIASNSVKYLGGARLASQETSTGARMGAEAIGAINETISSAKNVSKAFKASEASEANKVLGLGLGLAALAGLLTTTTSSPRRTTNNYRPEETTSTSGAIPGEGVSGSHSSNPPRTQTSSPANVTQAMVAPIRQNTDVEVEMRTDDPSRATEASKMVARSSGSGQTIVTNNYRNNTLTSLRNKSKLRERLNESS